MAYDGFWPMAVLDPNPKFTTDRYQRINLNGVIKTKPTLPCSLIESRFNRDYETAPKGECVAENRAFLSTEPDLACLN